MNPGTAIEYAHAARRAGRLDAALRYYRAAAESAQDDPEANALYGLMLLHLERDESH